ncbi:MAG: response regulator transcription factor [Intestinibacter sp.]
MLNSKYRNVNCRRENGKYLNYRRQSRCKSNACTSDKSAGYGVKSSFTGIDGLNEIKTNSYSLVLLDIMLPYKSGDEILKEVRQFSQIPIIIISAKDMISTKIDLLKLGADDYITKPFDLGEVVARIESNLRRYSFKHVSDLVSCPYLNIKI